MEEDVVEEAGDCVEEAADGEEQDCTTDVLEAEHCGGCVPKSSSLGCDHGRRYIINHTDSIERGDVAF